MPRDGTKDSVLTGGILPLTAEGLTFAARGTTLLGPLDVTFEAGARSLVLGANGAGKSLLLRLCHGLIQPTSGRVSWNGASAARAAKRQAMVFQRPVLLRRSARANVVYALALKRVPRTKRKEIADAALERAGLGAIAERQARLLSGGEQQRLAIARAWACEPEVLFLDEPTASLDPSATRAVEALILQVAEAGTKIVMTTHDLGQARRLAEDVLFLHRGRLLERAPAERFFAAPESAEAAAFIEGRLLW